MFHEQHQRKVVVGPPVLEPLWSIGISQKNEKHRASRFQTTIYYALLAHTYCGLEKPYSCACMLKLHFDTHLTVSYTLCNLL
jgi:hypothetical protein